MRSGKRGPRSRRDEAPEAQSPALARRARSSAHALHVEGMNLHAAKTPREASRWRMMRVHNERGHNKNNAQTCTDQNGRVIFTGDSLPQDEECCMRRGFDVVLRDAAAQREWEFSAAPEAVRFEAPAVCCLCTQPHTATDVATGAVVARGVFGCREDTMVVADASGADAVTLTLEKGPPNVNGMGTFGRGDKIITTGPLAARTKVSLHKGAGHTSHYLVPTGPDAELSAKEKLVLLAGVVLFSLGYDGAGGEDEYSP